MGIKWQDVSLHILVFHLFFMLASVVEFRNDKENWVGILEASGLLIQFPAGAAGLHSRGLLFLLFRGSGSVFRV